MLSLFNEQRFSLLTFKINCNFGKKNPIDFNTWLTTQHKNIDTVDWSPYQTNFLNVWDDNVNGLASDVETVLGVDLEEVSAHEGEDRDAVVQNVLGVCGRGLGQDQ